MLTPVSYNAAASESAVRDVGRAFASLGLDQVELVGSADWYRAQFPRSGTWEAWIWDTVNGKDYQTRRAHFAGYVVCETTVGRANAGILRLALQQRYPAFLWQDQERLQKVTGLNQEQADNWQAGWRVQTVAIGD